MDYRMVVGIILVAILCCLSRANGQRLLPQYNLNLPVYPESLPFSGRSADPSIILGQRAERGEFPYQAYLFSSRWLGLIGSSCGGSLIRPNWVLTAAHCIQSTDRTEVRLGGTNFNNMTYRQIANFRRVHERYNSNTLENDVALLRLPVNASGDQIGVIEMAPADIGTLEGETVVASGFGRTTNTGETSPDLMRVDLRAISNAECQETYGGIIVNSTLCATWQTQSGESTCQGDSGGPLSYNSTNGNVLAGVVSFVSSSGCDSGAPSGYARVSAFRQWVENTIAQNS